MKTLTFVVSWPVLTGPKKFPHSTLVCSILHLPDCLTEQTSCFKNSDILHLLLQELWSFAPYTSELCSYCMHLTLLIILVFCTYICFKNSDLLHLMLRELWSYAPYSFNNFGLLHLMLQELCYFAPYASRTLIFCTLCIKNSDLMQLTLLIILVFCTLCFENFVILHLKLQELWSYAPSASRTLILCY